VLLLARKLEGKARAWRIPPAARQLASINFFQAFFFFEAFFAAKDAVLSRAEIPRWQFHVAITTTLL